MGKINTGLVSALCGLALAASAPAAATSAGAAAAEIGGAVLFGGAAALFGYEIAHTYNPTEGWLHDTVVSANPFGVGFGWVVFAAYPLAASTGTYLLGEGLDGPSAEKGATFGRTTFFAYGQTLVLAFAAGMVGMAEGVDSSDAYKWAFWVDVSTKPFLTTYVYNSLKRPAAGPRESRLAVEPYVCAAAASDGGAVPLYGVTVSF
jgi:hypothetical protein